MATFADDSAVAQAHTLGTSFVSLTAAEASMCLRDLFGTEGTVVRLPTEKDDTFRVDLADGGHYLLKAANPFENDAELAFECELLQYVESKDPDLPVPRLLPNTDGSVQSRVLDGAGHLRHVRLLTYLEGTPLDGIAGPLSPGELEKIGESVARLRLATAGFQHPADGRIVAWDVQNFPSLSGLLGHVTDLDRRRCVEEVFARFAALAGPISRLRRQVLHNDSNRSNIIVDRTQSGFVSGIIDFGDSVRTAIAIDAATALLNQLPRNLHEHQSADLFADGRHLLRGYLAVAELTDEELRLIPHLVTARCAARALITVWRGKLFPERAQNILRYTESGWLQLEWLLSRSMDELSGTFL